MATDGGFITQAQAWSRRRSPAQAIARGPAAAQQPAAAGKSKLDEVRARGKVIVGVTSEAPPFGFIDEKGELVGFDIDVAKLIAKGIFGDETQDRALQAGLRRALAQHAERHHRLRHHGDDGLRRSRAAGRVHPALHRQRHRLGGEEGQPHQDDRRPKQGREHRRTPDRPGAGGARQAPLSKAKFLTFDAISAQFNAVKLGRATAASSMLPSPSITSRTIRTSAFSTSG